MTAEDKKLMELVRVRSGSKCEYCQLPVPPFHIEHIIAKQHGGPTIESNLSLACMRCNFHKGPNLSGIDPQTSQIVQLFHPRLQAWQDHFRWQGFQLSGLTPEGRATIIVLQINNPLRVERRERLVIDRLMKLD